MREFRLTQPELIVLAQFLLGIPLPPLGFPPDPELAERPVEEVVQKALEQLQAKGWVQVDEEGQPHIEPELVQLLRTAAYVERWMTVMVHPKGELPRQVGFYHDGERVVRHELDAATQTHIFRPGPEDMGYAWLQAYVTQFAAATESEDHRPIVLLTPPEWDRLIRARLEGFPVSWEEMPLERRDAFQDILDAALWIQLQCLCSVYTGEREEVAFLLGPERNWMWTPGPCPRREDEEAADGERDIPWCLQGRKMSLQALQRTLKVLWRALSAKQEVGEA